MNLLQQNTLATEAGTILSDIQLGLIRHHMVRIEDNAPDFSLVNQNGHIINLHDQLDKGPVVLAFVNGGDIIKDQTILCELEKLRLFMGIHNASLMIIAPHSNAFNAYRKRCNKLNTNILHDIGNQVANRFGLVHEPSYRTSEYYEDFAVNHNWLNHGDEKLPVAAIYVIHPNRRITFSHANTEQDFDINTQEIHETLKEGASK